jgi:tetratricopeptide (TPR) repeat protein
MIFLHRLARALLCLLLIGPFATLAAAQPTPDSEIRILQRLAEERYAKGDLPLAAETYKEIAAKQTDPRARAEALFTASWLRELSGDTARALESLTDSLEIDPEQPFDASLYNRDFELLYQQALSRALEKRHRQSVVKTQAAVTEIQAGRHSQARALLEEATLLDANNPSALYNLALLDLAAGASPKALGDFERVVSLTYKDNASDLVELRARALTSMGVIYQQQGRSGDAEQSFLEATRADPTESKAWLNLGLLQFHQRKFESSSTSLERAHELLPENRDVTRALARSLVEANRTGQAVTMLKTHLQRFEDDAVLWQVLGQLELERGETLGAIAALGRSGEGVSKPTRGIKQESASIPPSFLPLSIWIKAISKPPRRTPIGPSHGIDPTRRRGPFWVRPRRQRARAPQPSPASVALLNSMPTRSSGN